MRKESLGIFSKSSDTTDSHSDIELALQQNTQPTGTALIALCHAINNKINRLLKKHNIRKNNIPQCIPLSFWGLSRKDLELKAPGVYRIPCECGKVHVAQGAGAMESGHEPEKSAVAEGNISMGHCTDFGGIPISHWILRHVGGLVKEATEINLDKNNFDSDGGSCDGQVMNVTTGPIRLVTAYSAHQMSCLATSYNRALRKSRRRSE